MRHTSWTPQRPVPDGLHLLRSLNLIRESHAPLEGRID